MLLSWCAGREEDQVLAEERRAWNTPGAPLAAEVQQSSVTAWESGLGCVAIFASCRTGSSGTNASSAGITWREKSAAFQTRLTKGPRLTALPFPGPLSHCSKFVLPQQ
ncbi:unnamed protein product [Coccothraustes coccothraustes]